MKQAVDRMYRGMLGQRGAARFADFHMHAFARAGSVNPSLKRLVRRVLAMTLILRMLPQLARALAQINIPKSSGGFRPISITHDLYALITGEISWWMERASNKAKILRNFIAAYRRGLGTPQLTLANQCAIEDANNRKRTLLDQQDDFQKFFDACMAVFIQLSLRAYGLEKQGYVEWAAEATFDRPIHVITSVGVTAKVARSAGFLQGSAFSCKVVNFVAGILVMFLWIKVQFRPKTDTEGYFVRKAGYVLAHAGGLIAATSFCDDSNRFASTLVDCVLGVVLFGVFCIVSGIGRSDKDSCVLAVNLNVNDELENCTPAEAKLLSRHFDRKTMSIGSLAHDREARGGLGAIKWSTIPIKTGGTEYKLLGLRDSTKPGSVKHATNMIGGAKANLAQLLDQHLPFQQLIWAHNSQVSTVATWLCMQGRTSWRQARELDAMLTDAARKSLHMAATDSAHPLFLDKSRGGLGAQATTKRLLQCYGGDIDTALNDQWALPWKMVGSRSTVGSFSLAGAVEKTSDGQRVVGRLNQGRAYA